MRRCIIALIFSFLLFFGVLSLEISAAEVEYPDASDDPVERAQDDLWALIPDSVRELLPAADDGGTLDKVDADYLVGLLSGLFRDGLGRALSLFCSLLSLVLVSTLSEKVGNIFKNDKSRQIFGMISTLCVGVLLFKSLFGMLESVRAVLSEQNSFVASLGAIMSVLYLAGGNALASGTHMGWLALLLSVTEQLSYIIINPIIEISFSATLISSITGSVDLRPLARSVRGFFVSVLTLSMTVLSVILSFQTTLAAAGDSVSMRAVRYAAGYLPIIGGMVGESLKTLSTGLSGVKATVGTLGVIVVILLSLAPLITILAQRFALSVVKSIAEAVGSEQLSTLISDVMSLMGYLAALLVLFDLLFVFCLSVFNGISSAFG